MYIFIDIANSTFECPKAL